jgi:hypothetical protein
MSSFAVASTNGGLGARSPTDFKMGGVEELSQKVGKWGGLRFDILIFQINRWKATRKKVARFFKTKISPLPDRPSEFAPETGGGLLPRDVGGLDATAHSYVRWPSESSRP